MRLLAQSIVATAVAAAGLDVPVMSESKRDNLTQPSPRVEVAMKPERYQRTGRRLGTITTDDGRLIKRELYQVTAPVAVTFFSDDETWLDSAVPAVVAALPRGIENEGNWVRCRVISGNYQGYAAPRLGEESLEAIPKRQRSLEIELQGRITKEEPIEMITNVIIDVKEIK